ncbi:MAG TPA: hypothetical protein VMU43_08135 [Candidatus Acidoferrum sp.]|nr:hypothetical protein [Candidatus Acidoferrum sp.]
MQRTTVEYLQKTSDDGLESFQLARLDRTANLRKELTQMVMDMVDSEVEARLARWFLDRRRLKASGGEFDDISIELPTNSSGVQLLLGDCANEKRQTIGALPAAGDFSCTSRGDDSGTELARTATDTCESGSNAVAPPAEQERASCLVQLSLFSTLETTCLAPRLDGVATMAEHSAPDVRAISEMQAHGTLPVRIAGNQLARAELLARFTRPDFSNRPGLLCSSNILAFPPPHHSRAIANRASRDFASPIAPHRSRSQPLSTHVSSRTDECIPAACAAG